MLFFPAICGEGALKLANVPIPVLPVAHESEVVSKRIRFAAEPTKLGGSGYASRQVRAFGEVAWVLIVFGVSYLFMSYVISGPVSLWVAATVTAMAVIARLALGRVASKHVKTAKVWMEVSPISSRVLCVGVPRKIARVAALGPIEDRMFEPQVFLAVGSTKSPRRKQIVQIVSGVLIVIIATWIEWNFMHRITAPYILFIAGIGGAMLVGSAVYPTYLRVVPGRIDIMECALLGHRIISVRRIDLRTRAVTLDAGKQMLHIDSIPYAQTIPFSAIWNAYGFAHAALSAAISTHEPAPLPDDALIG